MTDLPIKGGARLSDCRNYRYRLWRTWDDARKPIVYVMLNPSVADEQDDDNTISRCSRRARNLGAGGIVVMNLFAWISPYRNELRKVPDPVGPNTDAELIEVCRGAMHVICGWGNHGRLHGRDQQVLALFRANGIRPMALFINKDGSPKHPLYVKYTKPLLPLDAGILTTGHPPSRVRDVRRSAPRRPSTAIASAWMWRSTSTRFLDASPAAFLGVQGARGPGQGQPRKPQGRALRHNRARLLHTVIPFCNTRLTCSRWRRPLGLWPAASSSPCRRTG